ncbi:DNA polymerase III subunit beta [Kitasatospora sp. NPDC002040]|uniref:DNA polymerase III subunit beta n=1 Tax=Kitasatospora sp. NPDC002040 TaxID=3154661 RepID=UPI0033337DB1
MTTANVSTGLYGPAADPAPVGDESIEWALWHTATGEQQPQFNLVTALLTASQHAARAALSPCAVSGHAVVLHNGRVWTPSPTVVSGAIVPELLWSARCSVCQREYDYETVATCRVDAEVADVDLELDGARLRLLCGGTRFTLPTLPVDEYPGLPDVPDTVLTVQGDALANAVTQTAIAADTDDSVPALTGLQLALDGDQLTLAATDRYRFAVRNVTVEPTGTLPGVRPRKRDKDAPEPTPEELRLAAGTVLVPARFLAEASRALAGEHPVRIGWTDSQVTLSVPGRTIGTRLLDVEFPKYSSIWPDTATAAMTLTVTVEHTAAALKRVALVATRETPVRLTVDATRGVLLLEAGHGDDAQALDRVECSVTGALPDGADTAAFNPGFLADCLKSMTTPQARFHFTTATKPVVVIGTSGDHTEDDYQHLLMPVRLT